MRLFLDGGRKANYQEEEGQAEEKVVPVPVNTTCFSSLLPLFIIHYM